MPSPLMVQAMSTTGGSSGLGVLITPQSSMHRRLRQYLLPLRRQQRHLRQARRRGLHRLRAQRRAGYQRKRRRGHREPQTKRSRLSTISSNLSLGEPTAARSSDGTRDSEPCSFCSEATIGREFQTFEQNSVALSIKNPITWPFREGRAAISSSTTDSVFQQRASTLHFSALGPKIVFGCGAFDRWRYPSFV